MSCLPSHLVAAQNMGDSPFKQGVIGMFFSFGEIHSLLGVSLPGVSLPGISSALTLNSNRLHTCCRKELGKEWAL